MVMELTIIVTPNTNERKISHVKYLQTSPCKGRMKRALSTDLQSPDAKKARYLIRPTSTDHTIEDVINRQESVVGPSAGRLTIVLPSSTLDTMAKDLDTRNNTITTQKSIMERTANAFEKMMIRQDRMERELHVTSSELRQTLEQLDQNKAQLTEINDRLSGTTAQLNKTNDRLSGTTAQLNKTNDRLSGTTARLEGMDRDRLVLFKANLMIDLLRKAKITLPKVSKRAGKTVADESSAEKDRSGHESSQLTRFASCLTNKDLDALGLPRKYLCSIHNCGEWISERNVFAHESGQRFAQFLLEPVRVDGPDYHYYGKLFPFVYGKSVEEVAKKVAE